MPDGGADVPIDRAARFVPSGGFCDEDEDCSLTYEICHPPREAPGGGGDAPPACRMTCDSDDECVRLNRPGYICLHGRLCSPSVEATGRLEEMTSCEPGCTLGPCLTGETCQPDARCRPTDCQGDSDCPPNFGCRPAGDGGARVCQRRTCTGDAQCQGFCVKGQCFPTAGKCWPPAA
jgi:hypothetical protein